MDSTPNENSSSMSRTYANASKSTRSYITPKRNQAIIIDSSDDFRLTDYVVAVGNIVGPKNILSASRIANGRICIYLSNTSLVDHLTDTIKTIKIEEKTLRLRKLVTPAKRILLSNVSTSIPNSALENIFKDLGLTLVSPITTLRAGIQDEAYSHVESFRRQVFVSPPPEDYILPSSTLITHDETNFRVFLTFDDMACFVCKQTGHTAARCPNNSGTIDQPEDIPATITHTEIPTTSTLLKPKEKIHEDNLPKKRPASETSETVTEPIRDQTLAQISGVTENSSDNLFLKPPTNKYTTKKKKTEESASSAESISTTFLETALLPVQPVIQNAKNYPLDFNQLLHFLSNVDGNTDLLHLLKDYTENTTGFLTMLKELYPHLQDRKMKVKFTKIRKRILYLQQRGYDTDWDTDASQNSTY